MRKEDAVINSKIEHIEKTIYALLKEISALVDEVSPGSSFSAYRTHFGVMTFNNAYWRLKPDERLWFSEIDGEFVRLDNSLFNILQPEGEKDDEA